MSSAVALLACSGLLVGCGDDDGGGDDGGTASFTVTTFNGGLAPGFVPYAEERAPHVYEAAGGLETDLMCVQEFWFDPDRAGLMAAAPSLSNTVFVPAMQETSDVAPCNDQAALDAMLACANANCEDPPQVACIVACADEFDALSSDCKGCVQAQFGNTIDDILGFCSQPADLWVYDGEFGIGILTSRDILEEDNIILDSNTTRRAVAYAKVDSPIGEVHAFCTHLTAGLSTVPHPKESEGGSWEAEQKGQIDDLRNFIDSKAGSDGLVILLGDLNTGPDVGSIEGEFIEHYDLIAAGFTNHYADQGLGCTFCNDNTLVDGSPDESPDRVIDHILTRNFSGTAEMSRQLDGLISVDTNDDGTIESNISDHFAVHGTYSK